MKGPARRQMNAHRRMERYRRIPTIRSIKSRKRPLMGDAGTKPTGREGMVTRHLNGQPLDNRAENLKWGTPSENALDRYTHGTANFHGGRVAPVLTDLEVIDVYARTQLGETVKEIHAHYPHVSREHIRLIVRGQARQPVIKRWLESHLQAGAA